MDFSMYTSNDKELALEHVSEYLEGNNRYEQLALTNKYEKIIMPPNIKGEIQKVTEMTYGVNIVTIGNFLKTQDLFFGNYMPHWIKYLTDFEYRARCIYMKPASYTVSYIIMNYQKILQNKPLLHWDPNAIWTDLSYNPNNIQKNLMNPLNSFYDAYLTIDGINNPMIFSELDKLFEVNHNTDSVTRYGISIRVLPSKNPNFMQAITKILHKYI